MDLDEIEPSREASSSEPPSFRPKPFHDDEYDDQSTSRKRQRMESDEPENTASVAAAAAVVMSSPIQRQHQEAILPTTPTRIVNPHPTTPNSNKVTLNLRSTRDLETIPSSSSPPHSPITPSKAAAASTMDMSTEPEVDTNNNIHQTIETPSSSLSSEPEVMLVESEQEYYSDSNNPTVAIIDDDIISGIESVDPTYAFPFVDDATEAGLQDSAYRLAQWFETGSMHSSANMGKLQKWLIEYLRWARRFPEDAFNSWREHKDFWDQICEVIRCLAFRQSRPHFGQWLKVDMSARQTLSGLLQVFAALAGQFTQMDLRTLVRCKEYPEMTIHIASRSFLELIWYLLARNDSDHIGKWLAQHYSWDWQDEIANMHTTLENQGASLRIFTELGAKYLELLPRFPKLVDNFREIDRYVVLALRFSPKRNRNEYSRRIAAAYSFFELMELHLCTFIEKNATFLHSEYVLEEIQALSEILEYALETQVGPGEDRLRQTEESDLEMIGSEYLPKATAARWKLSMLTKLITSSQMQLRVGATHSFCAELLKQYAIYNKVSHVSTHLLTRNIGKYIVSINLVDYIVGVGSHPEIIAQSGDMIGFLAVTKTYTNQHTDKIWSTVKSSLDPRVVKSVLVMLNLKVINLLSSYERMYFCTKLQEIPVESFAPPMRQFCEQLFKLVCDDAKTQSADLEAPPYEVCVRLIRESTVARADTPMAFNEVQQWASTQFEILTSRNHAYGPDTSVRLRIYESCLDDLRNGKTADGSLIALSILVEANLTDLRQLVGEHSNFLPLLIENFSWRKTSNSIVKHLRLFRHIITIDFIKDSANLGLQLWNKIIGADEADFEREERQHGWKMLCGVMKDVKPDNTFINACIHQYLPNLPPHLFSVASFSFARDTIGCFGTDEFLDPQNDESPLDKKGVEQLWRMVLTSHDNALFQNYATSGLISFYLESPAINNMPEDKSLEIHLAFVNRCLQQLTSAAGKLKSFSEGTMSGDDEPMVIVVPDKEVYEQETLFCRSLSLLKGFLRTYDSSNKFTPKKIQPQILSAPEILIGDVMDVSYQVFDEKSSSPVRTFSIGKLNTGASLFGSLQKAAGFEHFRVHYFGKEVNVSEIDLSKSLEELRLGTHLMLVSRARPLLSSEASPVRSEVMKRFDDLFELLSLDGTQARDIYDLLVGFSPYGSLIDAICTENVPCQELFPAQYPYRSLYAMYCLRFFIDEKFKSPSPDVNIKCRCCDLLIETLISHEYLDSHTDQDFKLYFFHEVMECLGYFSNDVTMRDRLASSETSEALVDRLMTLLADSHKSRSLISTSLSYKIFWTIMVLATTSPSFWTNFKGHPETVQILEDLLLRTNEAGQKDHATAANHPVKTIGDFCSKEIKFVGPLDILSQADLSPSGQLQFLQFFWPLLLRLVPTATLYPNRCEQVLNLVQILLKAAVHASKVQAVSVDGLDLRVLVNQWGQLFNSHKVVQYVGRPVIVDPVSYGLASLLKECVKNLQPPELESLRSLAVSLFNTHLFPDVFAAYNDNTYPPPDLPLLDTTTRSMIVEVILALTEDDPQSHMSLMKLTTNLVPGPPEDGEYMFELNAGYDRSYEIRSDTGYVGLKNLSNTCYLNSLMTQLFMNVSFRKFMINAHVAEGGAQNLLQQTQKLFCEMQNSFRRCANPHELAQSIKTYDETAIDVSIQMDVDEFYNLIFDRWEGQILAADAKAEFRSFYGGQLVQQVKSKECAHISERLEPFSAIQCDIKGKQSLEESLQAYVDGEIMEGDNKYKCSTCDQHVDAVKRACLKDVPDNLIFHLKRFDYNLREGRRNKLNDYFSFPNTIDMRPYKVDYLTNGPEGSEEDIFELVGVLVHSGTAESGHYYSYIRERPAEDSKSWVEFNDDQVSSFDPTNIEACCFGGANYQLANNEYQFDKSYSAYMLFYQRRSFLIEQKQKLGHFLGVEPLKLPINPTEAQDIDDDNAVLMRKYALYDPSHAHLVKRLLSRLEYTRAPPTQTEDDPDTSIIELESLSSNCSTDHTLEDQALKMVFNHMDQVFSRTKDTPDSHYFVSELARMFTSCVICSERFTKWISTSQEACKHFLVKCGDSNVRSGIADLITIALKTLKRDAPHIYGLQQDARRSMTPSSRRLTQNEFSSAVHQLNTANGAFGVVLEALVLQWDTILTNLRAWPEYFALIGRMIDGLEEAALLLDNGILSKVMDIIMASYAIDPSQELIRMLTLMQRRSATKPVSLDIIITLMDRLFGVLDSFGLPLHGDNKTFRSDQLLRNLPMVIWNSEKESLVTYWTANHDNIFVGELLKHNTNLESTESILKTMLTKMADQDLNLGKQICAAIVTHLGKNNANYPPGPYLNGALMYCRYIKSQGLFNNIVQYIKDTIKADPGQLYSAVCYLQFFKDLAELPSNRVLSNEDLFILSKKALIQWAPSLLINFDPNVRIGTENYITETILEHCMDVANSDDEEYMFRYNLCLSTAQHLGIKCLELLDDCYVHPNKQVQRSIVTNIRAIVEGCRPIYDEGSELYNRFMNLYMTVWNNGMSRLMVTRLDDEGSLGSDDWEQSDAELSTSSLLAEDRDVVSLIENNDL